MNYFTNAPFPFPFPWTATRQSHQDQDQGRNVFGAIIHAGPVPIPVGFAFTRNDGGRVAFLMKDESTVLADTLLLVLTEEEVADKKRAWALIHSNVGTNREEWQRKLRVVQAQRATNREQRNCGTNRSSNRTNHSSTIREQRNCTTNRSSNRTHHSSSIRSLSTNREQRSCSVTMTMKREQHSQ